MRIVQDLLSVIIGLLFYLPLTAQTIPDSSPGSPHASPGSLISQAGVSHDLAVYRSRHLRDIHYILHFSIPADRQTAVTGVESVSFTLDAIPKGNMPLLLDFKSSTPVSSLQVNGNKAPVQYANEHLLLNPALLHPGANTVDLSFTAGNAALNRNTDFLYTLLVPDRARTLFPCFDQPDLKAVFTLSLVIPAGWKAMANALLQDSVTTGDSCRLQFRPSDRISTYLFSFVAGHFTDTARIIGERVGDAGSRPVHFFYRETDSSKLRLSMDSIFRIEAQALHFMQQYTGIAYPFQKFGFVAIPDFQFGGMEHVGAIQYKASSLFLDSGATREQFIGRSNLLSHETAHMWFGDMVTMTWFNDVWMKEVFANFMADKISSVTLPDDNYDLKFLTAHYPAAYSVDRTAGANPIRQRLDNLQEAGSLYGNIIYNKAPIVMRQLERLIGTDAFQLGLRDYLSKYAGGNASWPDLVAALQAHTAANLAAWNEIWVNGTGRPQFGYHLQTAAGKITDFVIRQRGEDGSGRVWPQVFDVALVYADRVEDLPVNMNTASVRLTAADGKEKPLCVLFNAGGQGYGVFPVDPNLLAWLAGRGSTPLMRASAYINLYENMLNGQVITPRQLLAWDRRALSRETEELDLNILLDQISLIFWRFIPTALRDSLAEGLQQDCWQAMQNAPTANEKKLLFRAFSNIALTRPSQDILYAIWKNSQPPPGVKLSEDDYTGIAVALALRVYPGYHAILEEQLARIQNKDRKERLQYLLPSLSDDATERDRYFATLSMPDARRKEAWVLAALSNLHHPLRTAASEKYLRETLDWLEDIQRTGDVFFPQSWLQASLSGYQTATAAAIVRNFLKEHPDYNPKLKAKILQAADNLFRAEKLMK
jgi:aminopeptidase N